MHEAGSGRVGCEPTSVVPSAECQCQCTHTPWAAAACRASISDSSVSGLASPWLASMCETPAPAEGHEPNAHTNTGTHAT